MTQLGQMCLIAFDRAAPLDLLALRGAMQAIAPASTLVIERRQSSSRLETALLVELDGEVFAVHVAPGRIPEREYEEAVRGNLLWPDAADRMARHGAFAALCGVGLHGSLGAVCKQAAALTRLCSAVAEAAKACGVHWVGTGKMTAPERLRSSVADLDSRRMPVDLWVGYRLDAYNEDQGGAGATTRGAAAFLGAEVEIAPLRSADRTEPVRRLFAAVGTLMRHPDGIADNMILEVQEHGNAQYRLDFGRGGDRTLARLVPVD